MKIERYEIRWAGSRASLDLCDEHAGPLRGLLKSAKVVSGRKRASFEDSMVSDPSEIPKEPDRV